MRKSFIRIVPTETLKLTTRFKRPKYVTKEESFYVGSFEDYFIEKTDRYKAEFFIWLSAMVEVTEEFITITSEAVVTTAYYENRSNYDKLFYDLVKKAKQQLRQA